MNETRIKNNRREFRRFTIRIKAKFNDLHRQKQGSAVTHDVSATGVGIITKEKLKQNTPLELWLNIPGRIEPLYMKGEVAWSKSMDGNGYRVGISLEKTDFMTISRLLQL